MDRTFLATTAAVALLAPLALPAWAQAQTTQTPPSAAETTVSEVVITAAPTQVGAVVGDIVPELQLDPADIQSYGVSSLAELISQLAPQTRSERGRGGAPVVLVNGRRVSGFAEIRDLPTEAILRVDILPEEAALKYGFPASQRVINFVLQPSFRATTVELSGGGPVQGGRLGGVAEVGLFRIQDDRRLSVDLKVQASSALTEDERDLDPLTASRPFDLAGNVRALTPGAQIDPALSGLAGRTVLVAGVPRTAGGAAPTLADFALTADRLNTSDVRRFRTLLPKTQTATLNAVYSQPLSWGLVGTINAELEATQSDSALGLPGVSLAVPAGNPFSPFAGPVVVDRYVAGLGPLRQSRDNWTATLGGGLNRDAGAWRLSLTGAFKREQSDTDGDALVDASGLQALISGRSTTVNPFGDLPSDLLAFRGSTVRSTSDQANLQGVATGQLFRLPAGAVRTSLRLGATHAAFRSQSERLGVAQSSDLTRDTLNGQMSLDLPLASRRAGVAEALGELSANVNLALEELSDFGGLITFGYGLNWRPMTKFSLIASANREENAPGIRQLGDPSVFTPGSRVFDFVTGRTVDVVRVSGGNPRLGSETRDVVKLGLNFSPLNATPMDRRELVFSANYVDSRARDAISTFPAATAAIQAAFPDRFVRDAAGNLIQVDYRPVTFRRDAQRSFRTGFNYSQPFGPQPPPQRPGRPGGGPGGGPGGRPGGGPGGGGGGFGPPSFAAGGPPPGAFAGGGPGGGRGGPGGRLQASLYHTVYLRDEALVRAGVPVLDRLDGAALEGAQGGRPRHEIEAELGASAQGLGARLTANWKSSSTVAGGPASAVGDLSFSDLTTVGLRVFADLDQRKDLIAKAPLLKGVRVSLGISNLFDQRRTVRDAAGATPIGYQPDNLDPIGRAVRLSFRKLFL